MNVERDAILRRVAKALGGVGDRAGERPGDAGAAGPKPMSAATAPAGADDSPLSRFVAHAARNRAEVQRADSLAEVVATARRDGRCILRAVAGIAEIGAVAITSDQANLAEMMLADHLTVALRECDVLESMDALWPWLRARRPDSWPRAVQWVAGPSRTADIEQTLTFGRARAGCGHHRLVRAGMSPADRHVGGASRRRPSPAANASRRASAKPARRFSMNAAAPSMASAPRAVMASASDSIAATASSDMPGAPARQIMRLVNATASGAQAPAISSASCIVASSVSVAGRQRSAPPMPHSSAPEKRRPLSAMYKARSTPTTAGKVRCTKASGVTPRRVCSSP